MTTTTTTNRPHRPIQSTIETAVITLSGPLVGLLFNPTDPFYVLAPLPWLMLAPLLCGAQYGMAHGVASGAVLSLLALSHHAGAGHAAWIAVSNWSLGALIVGAIVGQFRDSAERQRVRLAERASKLAEDHARVQRAAQVLQLSHARLEERLAATRWSLASALERAGRRMQALSTVPELGDVVLDVLASQAAVQSATLYWRGTDGDRLSPVANLGGKQGNPRAHPLVERARDTGHLAVVGDAAAPRNGDDSDVLAAVPLVVSDGRTVGVIAIHQMPFMAFQDEHVRGMLVIATRLADLMNDRERALSDDCEITVTIVESEPVPTSVPLEDAASMLVPGIHHAGRG